LSEDLFGDDDESSKKGNPLSSEQSIAIGAQLADQQSDSGGYIGSNKAGGGPHPILSAPDLSTPKPPPVNVAPEKSVDGNVSGDAITATIPPVPAIEMEKGLGSIKIPPIRKARTFLNFNRKKNRLESQTHLDRLRAESTSMKGMVASNIESTIASVQAEGESQKGAIRSSISSQISALTSTTSLAIAALSQEKDGFVGRLRKQASISRNRVRKARKKEIARVGVVVREKNGALTRRIAAVASKAKQDGEALAGRAESARIKHSSDADKVGTARKNSIPGGASSDERSATRSVIDGVVAKYKKQSKEGLSKLAGAARTEGNNVAEGVTLKGVTLAQGFGDDSPSIVTKINQLADGTLAQINALEKASVKNTEKGAAGALASVEATRMAAMTRFEATGESACASVDETVRVAVQNYRLLADEFGDMLEQGVADIEAAVTDCDNPDPDSVKDTVDALIARYGAQAAGLLLGIENSGERLCAGFQQGVASLDGDLSADNTVISSKLSLAVTQFKTTGDEQTTGAVAAMYYYGINTRDAAAKLVDDYSTALDDTISSVEGTLLQQVNDGMSKITRKVDEGIATGNSKLSDLRSSVNSSANEVHTKYNRAWYERAWDFIKGALIAIITAVIVLVVAAIVAVALVLAGVSAALLATIAAVVAVVTLVVVAVVSAYARWQEYKALKGGSPTGWTAVGVLLAGVGDAVGISQLWESYSGKRLCSEKALTDKQRGELFADGILALVTTVLMVREFTAGKDLLRLKKVAGAADEASSLSKNIGKVDDASQLKNVGKVDDASQLKNSGKVDDASQLKNSGKVDDAGKAKTWETASPDETWQIYKNNVTKGKFDEAAVKARHSDGWRYNPKSKRWSKPDIRPEMTFKGDWQTASPDELWNIYSSSVKNGKFDEAAVKARHNDGWRIDPATKRWNKPSAALKPSHVKKMTSIQDEMSDLTKAIDKTVLKENTNPAVAAELQELSASVKASPLWKPAELVAAPQGKIQQLTIELLHKITFHRTKLSKLTQDAAQYEELLDLASHLNTILGGLYGSFLEEGNTLETGNNYAEQSVK
jgi:hypothetical protein